MDFALEIVLTEVFLLNYCSVLSKWEFFIKMRAALLAPILPRVMEEGESKKAALILMKNSHFSRTPLYLVLLPRRAEFMAISANARMWNHRFIHRRCQIYFLFYLYERERAVTRFSCFNEFMPGLQCSFCPETHYFHFNCMAFYFSQLHLT